MNTDRTRAIAVAKRWLDRVDINPDGELALVARELIRATDGVEAEPIDIPAFLPVKEELTID